MKEMNTPYVFFSWSGELSKKIAEAFSDLFRAVFAPTIESFMSSKDIGAGTRSIVSLFEKLEECNYGICFVTSENARAPWIQFEAGALSKIINESQVVVLLLDEKSINSLDGTPLGEFQHKLFNREDIKSIFKDIIKKYGFIEHEDSFSQRFDVNWDEFYNKTSKMLDIGDVNKEIVGDEKCTEIEELDTIKKMLLNVQNLLKTDYSQNVKESLNLFSELKRTLRNMEPEDLKVMKMQFKVERYELVFQQNIQDIEEIIDDLEIDNKEIDNKKIETVREKLNNIIGRTMSLISD